MNLFKKFCVLIVLFFPLISHADDINIVTYNIEWLGNPTTAGYNGSESEQINAAAADIISGGGDIYALQEIGGSDTLDDLISALNSLDGNNLWDGEVSQPTAAQSLAFVYNTAVVNSANFQTILTNEDSYNFASRYPYLMTASVTIGSSTAQLYLVNLHLKCCTGTTNAARRAGAMQILVDELNDNYDDNNVIVLGDLNVADEGGANGEIADWGFYDDNDFDGTDDYSHAAGSVADTVYNPADTESDIDHILISDELKSAWDAVSANERNEYLSTTVSDHSPVKTTLDLSQIGTSSDNGGGTPGDTDTSDISSVTEALAASTGSDLIVEGEIVDYYNTQYAMVIRDVSNDNEIIVKLEASQRATWSPYLNSSVLGTTVVVEGTRDTYSGQSSIEYVSNIEVSSGSSNGGYDALSVTEALSANTGTELTVVGEITAYYNTQYAMVISDISNANNIVVKLEADQRSAWSPYLNASVVGTFVIVEGVRDTYSGQSSIEYVTTIEQAN